MAFDTVLESDDLEFFESRWDSVISVNEIQIDENFEETDAFPSKKQSFSIKYFYGCLYRCLIIIDLQPVNQ